MNSLNKAILIGRLGKDPEMRYLEGNVAKAAFPLATSESYKDKSGQKVENTNWHNIVCWRGLAEIAELSSEDIIFSAVAPPIPRFL
jgi:single-strand DNA-binding protein